MYLRFVAMSAMTPLQGPDLRHSRQVLKLSAKLREGASLLTKENLVKCGFVPWRGSASRAESSHQLGLT